MYKHKQTSSMMRSNWLTHFLGTKPVSPSDVGFGLAYHRTIPRQCDGRYSPESVISRDDQWTSHTACPCFIEQLSLLQQRSSVSFFRIQDRIIRTATKHEARSTKHEANILTDLANQL